MLLPLSTTEEWGEDRGEGQSQLHAADAPPLPGPLLHRMEERECSIAASPRCALSHRFGLGLLFLVLAVSSHAQPFSIDWHTIGGGGGTSIGGAFSLSGSIGRPEAEAVMTGGNLSLIGGFWGVDAAGQTPDTTVTPPVPHTWTGTLSGNWSEPRNWSPATVPDVDDPILFPFPGTAANRMITNDLPARVVGDITFGGHSFEISGNPIILGSTLGGKTITVASTASNIIHLDIVVAGPVTIKAGGSLVSKQLMLRGNISLGSHRLTIVNGGDVICSGVISGTGGISKSDQGKLVFSGASANSYSGATIISEGTFELNKSGVIAVPADLHIGSSVNSPVKATAVHAAPDQIADHATVFVLRTGELRLNNYDDTISMAELSSGKITTGSGLFTVNREIMCVPGDGVGSSIAGRLNLGAETTVVDVQSNAVLVISAVVGSGPAITELRKKGLGELQLGANNSYTARTRVTDGTLRVSASGGLGGSKEIVVEDGRLLLVNSINDGKKLVASGPGTIATEGPASSWNGPLNLTGTVAIDTAVNSSLSCSGRIDGPGGFRKTGAGFLRLAGTEANTFQGGATVLQGVLDLNKSSTGPTLFAIPGPLTVGDATPMPGRAIVRYGTVNQIADDAQVTVERSGRVMMLGWPDSIGSLSGMGEMQLSSATLTVGGASELSSVFSGVISGAGSLVKTGDSTLTLSGVNTFTSDTVVGQGTLLVHGELAPASLVRVQGRNSILGGNGRVHNVNVSSAGKLTASDVNLSGVLDIELDGTDPGTGYDRLTARGAMNLSDCVLAVRRSVVLALGETFPFLILEKTSPGPILGTFKHMAEGARFSVNGELFQITYQGGDGNDVVLTRLPQPPAQLNRLIFAPGRINQLGGTGLPGRTYTLEATTGLTPLTMWTVIATAQADANGTYEFTESNAPLQPMRFYRVISP